MEEQQAKIKTGLEVTDAGDIVVQKTQEVQPILDQAATFRAESEQKGFQLSDGSGMTYVGTVPAVIVAQWEAEGFYVHSPQRSGLDREEHSKQLLKRLQAMPFLLTSRHKRLV